MDTIKFQKNICDLPNDFSTNALEVNWQGLSWKRKSHYRYYSNIKNLYLEINYGRLIISNSLHKFYHGNNFRIFTYKQTVEAIKQLNNYFDFSILDADVIKYTPGLAVESSPEDSYKTWIDYKTKEPYPMFNKNKVYGKYFKFGQVRLKGYNKSYQANLGLYKEEKLTDQLFRFEAEIYASYARNNYGINIKTVADLINYQNYCNTLDLLLKFYDNIKKDRIDYAKAKCDEIRLIGLFKESSTADKYKTSHPHTYKKDRLKFNNILKNTSLIKKDRTREEIIDVINTMKTY